MEIDEFELFEYDYESSKELMPFLYEIFHLEQGIPKEYLALTCTRQKWWVVKKEKEIISTVAIWTVGEEWHWGRLATQKNYRNQGISGRLLKDSFSIIFNSDIDVLHIDARDVTVRIIQKYGGVIVGEKVDFYGLPITPMILKRTNYYQRS